MLTEEAIWIQRHLNNDLLHIFIKYTKLRYFKGKIKIMRHVSIFLIKIVPANSSEIAKHRVYVWWYTTNNAKHYLA